MRGVGLGELGLAGTRWDCWDVGARGLDGRWGLGATWETGRLKLRFGWDESRVSSLEVSIETREGWERVEPNGSSCRCTSSTAQVCTVFRIIQQRRRAVQSDLPWYSINEYCVLTVYTNSKFDTHILQYGTVQSRAGATFHPSATGRLPCVPSAAPPAGRPLCALCSVGLLRCKYSSGDLSPQGDRDRKTGFQCWGQALWVSVAATRAPRTARSEASGERVLV